MDLKTLKSEKPESLGEFSLANKEYMQYLYLPIKLKDSEKIQVEPRLRFLLHLIEQAVYDYTRRSSHGAFVRNYIYLTVKQTFVPKDVHGNRPGFHSDGFGTKDVQYIWFDKFPTQFMLGDIAVPDDDKTSMRVFEKLAEYGAKELYQPECNHLYRIDENHVHRTTPATSDGVRCFVKLTFSESIYAQEGNSMNYSLDYDWQYAPRVVDRNQPHAK